MLSETIAEPWARASLRKAFLSAISCVLVLAGLPVSRCVKVDLSTPQGNESGVLRSKIARDKRHRSQQQRKFDISVDCCSSLASLVPLLAIRCGTTREQTVSKCNEKNIAKSLQNAELSPPPNV